MCERPRVEGSGPRPGEQTKRTGKGGKVRSLGVIWRRSWLTTAVVALTGALVFGVGEAFADAGNPILGTIKATSSTDGDDGDDQRQGRVELALPRRRLQLRPRGDRCRDRVGRSRTARTTRARSPRAVRNNNVVTVTIAAHDVEASATRSPSPVVDERAFNGGPFTITAVSGTTIKYASPARTSTSSGAARWSTSTSSTAGWSTSPRRAHGYIGTKVATRRSRRTRSTARCTRPTSATCRPTARARCRARTRQRRSGQPESSIRARPRRPASATTTWRGRAAAVASPYLRRRSRISSATDEQRRRRSSR